ncbi:MAG TPA: AraC family transcriptional regulator [Allosphingosinicella sp.]|jgi:AraC-like DNA-binding protein|nr:AraC family transcriptional regulator [Allosphingosinicella sp.]
MTETVFCSPNDVNLLRPGRPCNLAAEPSEGDALAEVFAAVRMKAAIFFRVAAQAPWILEQLSREAVLPMILPGAREMVSFHFVLEGTCYANLVGGESIKLTRGKVIVFTRGDPYVISSSPDLHLHSAVGRPKLVSRHIPFTESFGESGPIDARLVSGFLACDSRQYNPLLDNLPTALVGDFTSDSGFRSLAQLTGFAIDQAAAERAGGQAVLGRLTELMFIEVVRQYFEKLPPDSVNWLSALRDPSIGRALSLMHGDPGKSWTLESLAREVGVSRSEFADRFTSLVGVPPMQYLTKWRMQTAAGLLCESVNIASIANEVGYSCEASFSRAFKKIVGVPPSRWRQRQEPLAA